jgi:PAS domain-containing protein
VVLDTRPDERAARTPGPVRRTGVERTFAPNELIVSETDPRGVITYANDAFLRMGAYSPGEVIGQPHDLGEHGAGGSDVTGLSQMAERLQSEMTGFPAEMRS